MTAKRPQDRSDVVELLKDILIAQLGIAGVPQKRIRAIVGCEMRRVNQIVRHLRQRTQGTEP